MTSSLSFLSLEGGLWAGFFFFLFLFLKEERWEQELLLVRKEGRKERRFPPPTGNMNFTGPAKGASQPASAGEAGRAHQSKCGSARPPVWHPGSSRLQVSPSKVWSPEQRPAHHLGTCEKLTCLGPNLDQTLCGAESGDGPPSEPPSGTPSGSGESLPLHATLW